MGVGTATTTETGTLQLTIDGMPVETTPGKTVLEAAIDADIYIPTLCYHPDVSPYGGCRLCLVDIEGQEGLTAACTREAEDGMAVRTDSGEIHAVRRDTLEMILADHEGGCLNCKLDGECQLQDVSRYLGLDCSTGGMLSEPQPVDDSNPFFTFNPNKCIRCGICVRTCAEYVGVHAIDFAYRGFQEAIVPSTGTLWVDSTCTSCGECVSRCPTGALTPKVAHQGSRTVDSVCPYCGTGCRVTLHLRGDRVVGVEAEGNAQPNEGRLCVKGRYGMEFQSSEHRLKTPLIRKDGEFVEASWDEALDLVARRFSEIKDQYGPNSLAVMSSSRSTNEISYVAQKLARAVFGTNNVDNCARICHSPSVHGLTRSFGSGAMTNSIREIDGAECILLIGSNPTEAHPVIGDRIRRAVENGTKLVVIDPRDTETAQIADLHLSVRPGTDVALANAIGHHIVTQGWTNDAFMAERTENYDAFWSVVRDYAPESVEDLTGVPAADIKRAAEMYATSEPSMILYCLGLTEHRNGVETVISVANLSLLTGHVGKPSSGVSPIRGQNNVQGACDMAAMPEVLPGYQSWEDPEVIEKFENAWGVEMPDHGQGIFCTGLWDKIHAGGIRGLYCVGEDPAMSEPNSASVRKALEDIDFLVVQELFMTPTAERADVILPAASFAEVDGTYTNTERRVQRIRKAVEPVGEARPDWAIAAEISNRMGYPMTYESASDVFEELRSLMPSYGGMTYERLDENDGLQWPCPTEDHPGTMYLHGEKFARGLGRFHGIKQQGPQEEPDEEYPFLMSTGRVREHYNVGSMTRRTNGLNDLVPRSFVEMNPADAERLGLKQGDAVKVSSRRGEVDAEVHLRNIKAGVVWMPFHFDESPTNLITNDALDPICGTPEYKACAVRIDKT